MRHCITDTLHFDLKGIAFSFGASGSQCSGDNFNKEIGPPDAHDFDFSLPVVGVGSRCRRHVRELILHACLLEVSLDNRR